MKSKYLPVGFEASEVIRTYNLLQMGLTYSDIQTISYQEADKLLLLQKTIKEVENEDIEEQKKSNR